MPHGYPMAREDWRRRKDNMIVRVEERMWHHSQWWLRCTSPGRVRRMTWFTTERAFLTRYDFVDKEDQ